MYILNNIRFTRFMAPDGDGGGGDKTFTQADVDKLLADRLAKERASAAKKYGDYDDLKKAKEELETLKASQMTETEKLKADNAAALEKLAASEAKIKALELSQLKAKLISASGLPVELAERVRGETEDEIKADIEALKPLIKPATKPIGGNGTPPNDNKDTTAGDYGRNLAKSMCDRSESAKKASESFFKL